MASGRQADAIPHYRKSLNLNPDWTAPLNDLAWILATDPQAELRNGREAVELAERACRLAGDREPRFLGTLDAAYAESGRFEDAIETAKKAMQLALAAGRKEIAEAAEQRLALYCGHQPFRQK